ncbi:hypothetical protein EFK09_22020 [Escherichia coli]|nr:hypothetical protein [Escherichia coli]
MMSLWDALRMNMMISYQELVRTFLSLLLLLEYRDSIQRLARGEEPRVSTPGKPSCKVRLPVRWMIIVDFPLTLTSRIHNPTSALFSLLW